MNKEPRNLLKMIAAAAKELEKIPEVPWTYKELDPIAVPERAYPGYYKGGCSYGVFEGIIGELKKEAGYPYIF